MASAQLLSQAEEGKLLPVHALHQNRILNNEKKAFERITNRLVGPNSILAPVKRPMTAEELAIKTKGPKDELPQDPDSFRRDLLLDFAAFESSIIRTQLLLNSNEQERERYAAEKIRIQAATQDVRENTAKLRLQLEEAKNQLALRKTYDELAEKITSNRLLKPRKDQYANLEKLNNEIAELERESIEYAQTWAERRAQFGRIIEEGMELRRQIRDEEEEVERREGMEGREDGDEPEVASRGRSSAVGSPLPEGLGATPPPAGGDGHNASLTVSQARNSRDKSPLRQSTPRLEVTTPQLEEPDDINMAEDGEVSGDEGGEIESEGLVAEDKDLDGHTSEDHESRNGDNMDTS
ncbi:MAG: hypothetical protein LQ340_004393 [Diploschistes diacapsis]|nr:MAG: hypothetical protein LQ340_004393 [Diploschistes diacapsis]